MRTTWPKLFLLIVLLALAQAAPYSLELEHSSVPFHHESSVEIPAPNSGDDSQLPQPDYQPALKELPFTPEQPSATSSSNCSTWRHTPETVRSVLWPEIQEEEEYAEPVDVTLLAVQFYDHYQEQYLRVSRVETWLYRRSYWEHTIYCNQARYNSFDVVLEDLEKGDSFEMRVTWEDGSHRTLVRTLGDTPSVDFYMDEPDYFEY